MSRERKNSKMAELVKLLGEVAEEIRVEGRPVFGHGHGESPLKGVASLKGSERWRAQIQLYLGTYSQEQDGAVMYTLADRLLRPLAKELRQRYGDLRDS